MEKAPLLFDQKVQKIGNFSLETTNLTLICDEKSKFLDFAPA